MPSHPAHPVRLSVVIPSWNAAELVSAAVDHLLRDGRPEHAELIVVDDGSDDETAAVLRARHPQVTVIEHPTNRGFGAAVNSGFNAARGRFLASVNNDALVTWDTLERVAAFLETEPRAAAGAPQIIDGQGRPQRVAFDIPRAPWRRGWGRGRGGSPSSARPTRAGYLKGACVVFRREALEDVGLFDEQFHMFAEEIDLFRRLAGAGWTVWALPDVQATHIAGVTSRNHPDPELAARFRVQSYRSLCIYYRKHHSWLGATCLRGVLLARLLARLGRSLVRSGPRWREPRGGREIVRCLTTVLRAPPSVPRVPTLAPPLSAPGS